VSISHVEYGTVKVGDLVQYMSRLVLVVEARDEVCTVFCWGYEVGDADMIRTKYRKSAVRVISRNEKAES